MNSVLKYPGSKWRIADWIISQIPYHHSYIEPFFGSGAVFFKKKPSNIETINDLDDNVTNLFSVIRDNPEDLARLITFTPYSRKEYDRTFDFINTTDMLEKARQFLVQCWQGHGFRTNGYKVGWKNDVQGRERMYATYNWYRLPEWILEIADRLKQVQIENRPAIEIIRRFNYSNVFMYLDPPYLLGTRTAKQYKHEMSEKDHIELLELILQFKGKAIISGYDNDLYHEMLKNWHKESTLGYAEYYGADRKEIIWMNFKPAAEQMRIELIT